MEKLDWNKDFLYLNDIIARFKDGKELPQELIDTLCTAIDECHPEKLTVIDIIMLEEMDIVGDKLLKLWNLGPKLFCYNVHFWRHIGEKQDLLLNLELNESVPFSLEENPLTREEFRQLDNREEYCRGVLNNFRSRYNVQAQKEGKQLLELKPKPKEEKKMDENEIIPFNDFYYGSECIDATGGILGLTFNVVSEFQSLNMVINIKNITVAVFKKVPYEEFVLIKPNGEVFISNAVIETSTITILPNKKTQSVKIASLPQILEDASSQIEYEFNLNNIDTDKYNELKSYIDYIELNFTNGIRVGDLSKITDMIRPLYEMAYGPLFGDEKSKK